MYRAPLEALPLGKGGFIFIIFSRFLFKTPKIKKMYENTLQLYRNKV